MIGDALDGQLGRQGQHREILWSACPASASHGAVWRTDDSPIANPHGERRETFSAPFFIDPPEHAEVEVRGEDDTGQAIRARIRVSLR